MSYTGHSFTPRGATPKKDKKKKQEFHKHKLKLTEQEHLDFHKLKERITLALEKLGNQQFSSEPGGYTFQNWMTSFNLLLDDFEEKAGPKNLPKDYYESRQMLTAELLRPLDTSEIDSELEKLDSAVRSTELEISKMMSELSTIRGKERETAVEMGNLKRERVDSERELASAVKELTAAKKKQTLFNRLLSGNKSEEIDAARTRVDSLEERQSSIAKRVKELEGASQISDDDLDNRVSLSRQKLSDLQASLAGWVEKKEKMTQLSEKRVQTTSELSRKISSIQLDTPTDNEGIQRLEE